MRIAVIGGGVSGMVAAAGLAERHQVTLFEAADHLGGHAHTVEVKHQGRTVPVDTGFMVFNETTYPELCRLFDRLGVASRPSDMSFSVRNEATGLEYCGSSVATLFAQSRNLARPAFLRMLAEVVRFNRWAPRLALRRPDLTLGELLELGGFSAFFRDHYLVPITAAVWSATAERALDMPASFLVRFYRNHGMLTVKGHLPWRTVVGGSVRYVGALARELERRGVRVRTRMAIEGIWRIGAGAAADGVRVVPVGRPAAVFDRVVLAVHADQALALLDEPTPAERAVLGALPYQRNRGVLHTDRSLLPRAPQARASWNYHVTGAETDATGVEGGATLTYDLTRLQGLPGSRPLLLTLNRTDRVDPRRVIGSFEWDHPVYTLAGVSAQGRRNEVSGADRIHYCGAYWRNGFHEDGVVSGLAVAREIEQVAAAEGPGRRGEVLWVRDAAEPLVAAAGGG